MEKYHYLTRKLIAFLSMDCVPLTSSTSFEVTLSCPILREQFCLLQNSDCRLLLFIGRIAAFPQYPLHHHLQLGTDSFPHSPINCGIVANGFQKFTSNVF